ncbi:MAG: protein kinase, partial [Clostridia bacterium]|nr:protein kinase [Clostridia bacterium]
FMAAYSLVVNLAFSSNWKYMAFRSNEGDVKIWRCAYMYFVPPGQKKGESERAAHYARFSRAMMSDPSSAAAAPRDSLFRSFEEVFTDMKAVRVFAAVRHSADPSKTADQLLPGMMEELRDRGFGSVGEKQVLEMLRGICPSSRTASAPAGMNDLMSALENAARDRMRKEDPKPAPAPEKPKPSSGMDDLLAALEKQARQRMGKSGPDAGKPKPADDPGATVYAPSGTSDAPEADPGKTIMEPAPDPGKTVMEPDDPGRTVPGPADPGKTVPGPESGRTAVVPADDGKTVLESAAPGAPSPSPEQSPEKPAVPSFEKGSLLLDTYRIESDPINGGMGSVWRVRHTGWNTDLAMKRPQPQMFSDEISKQNFISECRNWIDLGLHPNIVSCYYVREIDGVPAIFSEWMENGSLENHIQKGTLYEGDDDQIQSRLLDIAIQYARGLHYAHEQGLIHQDVKPDNLLLTKDWQAKAADFGLAKARAVLTVREQPEDKGATHMAASGGYTPAYCSMEQMDGKPLTRRTDIYSWAVSVMEMYLGGRPWQNGVVAGMSCRSYFDECRVKMPEKLRDLLEKCLDSDPEKRPHDFAIVEEELKKIYRDTLKSDYPRSAPKAAPDTADSLNNRALSYLDLGMPLQADALWQKAKFADPSNAEALFNSLLHAYRDGACSFNDAQESLAQISKVNDQGYVYSARLALEHGPEGYDLAARIAAIQNDPSLEEDLKETDRAGHYRCAYVLSRLQSLPDLEKREQRYDERARQIRELIDAGRYDDASALMMESINPASGYTGCIYRPEWMALNDRLSRRGFPVFMRVAFPLLTVRDTQFDDPISFSSDSSLLLSGGRLYNMATGELIRDHRTAEGKAMFSALSPDGTFLLRAEENSGAIRKIDARDGSVLESYDPFQAPLQALALSPDGTAFAGIDKNTGFCFWKDGKKVLEGRFDPGHVRNLRISYDNKQVTFIVDNSICLMNVESGKAQTLNIPFANLLNYAVNTAFTRLVACGDRDGYILYDLENKKTILQESLKTVQMRVMNIVSACFLPNDRYIAYSSLREIYPFAPEQHKWIMGFMAAYSLVVNLAFSSNWKYMAFRSNEGDVKIWRCAYMYFVPPGQKKG